MLRAHLSQGCNAAVRWLSHLYPLCWCLQESNKKVEEVRLDLDTKRRDTLAWQGITAGMFDMTWPDRQSGMPIK